MYLMGDREYISNAYSTIKDVPSASCWFSMSLSNYTIQAGTVIFLLAGGDKSTQAKDIEKAAQLLSELED